MIDSRLQVIYVVGIALNTVAMLSTAKAGEWLITVTFGVVIVYLSFRYRMATSS
jgi:hypothetical protein